MTEGTIHGRTLYYSEQVGWGPDEFYSLWRYFNLLFQRRDNERDAEIASLDLKKMTHETVYLMKHMLIDTKQFDKLLEEFPNLADLKKVKRIRKPLYLSPAPRGLNSYYTKNGIFL